MGDLTKNFSLIDVACPCCGVVKISPCLITGLQALRNFAKLVILVPSGYRCKLHNDAVGGAPNSQHLLGTAADIIIGNLTSETMAELADKIYVFHQGGIGIYPDHIHVDVREQKARWNKMSTS